MIFVSLFEREKEHNSFTLSCVLVNIHKNQKLVLQFIIMIGGLHLKLILTSTPNFQFIKRLANTSGSFSSNDKSELYEFYNSNDSSGNRISKALRGELYKRTSAKKSSLKAPGGLSHTSDP